jgi:hypothetical protein
MAVLNMISEPVLCKQAQHELEVAEKLGCDDPRLPGLKGIVQAELGQYDAALIQLKDALKSVDPSMQKWQHDLQAEIAKVEAIKKSQKPPTVPPEKRKYNIPDGAAALILHVDHVKKLTTMKFSDGHDPDRGKQDGLDDGIIEMPSTTVRPPDSVLRPK